MVLECHARFASASELELHERFALSEHSTSATAGIKAREFDPWRPGFFDGSGVHHGNSDSVDLCEGHLSSFYQIDLNLNTSNPKIHQIFPISFENPPDIPGSFNENLDFVAFPGTLRQLRLGDRFDQSLEFAELPNALESLSFGTNFNQHLEARDG